MNRFSTELSRLSWLMSAALGFSACAQGTANQPQRQPVAQPSTTSDGNPFNVTPPGSSSAGAGSPSGKGGASSSSNGSAGGAGGTQLTAGGSAGGAGSTAMTPAAGGSPAAASGGSGAAGASTTADCSSARRVRLASGQCVDRISEFSVATQPMSIALGADSRIWFDDGIGNQLVQLGDDGGVLNQIPFSAASAERELVTGRGDTLIWYTDATAHTVSKLTNSAQITSYALGIAPLGLGLAPDGQVWLTEWNQAVYRLDPVAVSMTRWPAAPSNTIVFAPDQNAWFPNSAAIARLTLAGDESDFSISDSASDLCVGPDGALWFTQSTDQVVHMALDGAFLGTYYLPAGSQPFRIVTGPDGAVWFTEKGADKIGRITVDGVVNHYPTPTSGAVPYGLAFGADHNLWFTERNSGKIGRLIPDAVQ